MADNCDKLRAHRVRTMFIIMLGINMLHVMSSTMQRSNNATFTIDDDDHDDANDDDVIIRRCTAMVVCCTLLCINALWRWLCDKSRVNVCKWHAVWRIYVSIHLSELREHSNSIRIYVRLCSTGLCMRIAIRFYASACIANTAHTNTTYTHTLSHALPTRARMCVCVSGTIEHAYCIDADVNYD